MRANATVKNPLNGSDDKNIPYPSIFQQNLKFFILHWKRDFLFRLEEDQLVIQLKYAYIESDE